MRFLTSSADGRKLAAVNASGKIYTSVGSPYNITVAGGSGLYLTTGFATSISPGPTNESSQTVSSFTVTNNNNSLFTTPPAISSTGALTFQPGIIAGTATVTVTAVDNGGTANGGVNTSSSQTFTITVTNSAPTNITLSSASIPENNAANAAVGSFSSTDPNGGNTFTYSFASGGLNNANFTLTGNTLMLTPSANFEIKNSYAIKIRSTDQGGQFFEKDFIVTITDVNEMPSFTKGANQIHLFGTTAQQSVSNWATVINDGDSFVTQILTFNVSIVSGGSIFTTAPSVNSAGTLTYKPNGTFGTATVTISLTDDAALGGLPLTTVVQTFTITVSNAAPTISNVIDKTINEDTPTSAISFTVGDVETAAASLTVSGSSSNTTLVPNGFSFSGSGASRTVTITPAPNQNGTVTISLNVNDGLDTTTDTFSLNINPVNDAPSFTLPAGSPYSLSVIGGSGLSTTAAVAANISPGPANESSQTVSFTVSNSNNSLFTTPPAIDANGTLTFTPSCTPGTATVTVNAVDNGGTANGGINSSAPQIFTITIIDSMDSWRMAQFGNPADSGIRANLADADFDGIVNLVEYAFGLNPNSGNSLQTPPAVRSGGNLAFTFTTPPGVSCITYKAEWSINLINWFPITDTGSGSNHIFSVPVGTNPKMFMRHRVSHP